MPHYSFIVMSKNFFRNNYLQKITFNYMHGEYSMDRGI